MQSQNDQNIFISLLLKIANQNLTNLAAIANVARNQY